MKPKPPPSNSPNPTAGKSSSNRPQRVVKIPVKKQNGETVKSKKEKLKDDVSVLMKSVSTSVTSLKEIIKLFKHATPEILDLITNECSIILECKICKNLFRSLANFMTHKRGFCLGKFEQLFQQHEHSDHMWYSKCRKNKVLSSRSTTRKDILDLIECMKGSVNEESSEVVVLKDLETTNEGFFNLRYETQDPAKKNEKAVTINSELSPEEVVEEWVSIDNNKCSFCQKEFNSGKSLTAHVKKEHGDLRICFVCPCCKKYFANPWSVYRHMYKVHRKTSEQVRKLRSQIQKKQITQDELDRSKKGQLALQIDNKDQEKAFMEDLKGHSSLQHCSDCGKRFDRKVALISHANHCQKKITPPEDLIRSLKRKSLTPLKVEKDKKVKYSQEEMMLRLKAIDARVVLTKADIPQSISLKMEKIDDEEECYEGDSYTPKAQEEINCYVETYKGGIESVNPAKQEDLLDKITKEYISVVPITLTDSDPENNDGTNKIEEQNVCTWNKVETESPLSSDGVRSISPESEFQDEETDFQEEKEVTFSRGVPYAENGEYCDSTINISDDENEGLFQANDEEQVDPLGTDNESGPDISSQEQENSVQELEKGIVQEDSLEEVDETNIEIQEIGHDNSFMLIDENIINIQKKIINENAKNQEMFAEDRSDIRSDPLEENTGEIKTNANECTNLDHSIDTEDRSVPHKTERDNEEIRTMSPTESDSLESDGFKGFSDVDDDSNQFSYQYTSITNNRNKIMLKEYEIVSAQTKKDDLSQPGHSQNSLPSHLFEDNTKDSSSSLQLDFGIEEHCYVSNEVTLRSEGTYNTPTSSSDGLANSDPLEIDQPEITRRYFSKLNGVSPCQESFSPQISEVEDDRDSVVEEGDWINKKINSLLNGQKKRCLLCLKTFHKVSFVRRHIASHYNINKFKCLVNSCNFKSFLRRDMNNHLMRVHKKKELDHFIGRLYPRKEDFNDSLYNPEPKLIYPFDKSNFEKVPIIENIGNDIDYSHSILLNEESLDGLQICEEMELPCVEESPSKLLRYESLDDDTGLPPLQNQSTGEVKTLVLDMLYGSKQEANQGPTLVQ